MAPHLLCCRALWSTGSTSAYPPPRICSTL